MWKGDVRGALSSVSPCDIPAYSLKNVDALANVSLCQPRGLSVPEAAKPVLTGLQSDSTVLSVSLHCCGNRVGEYGPVPGGDHVPDNCRHKAALRRIHLPLSVHDIEVGKAFRVRPGKARHGFDLTSLRAQFGWARGLGSSFWLRLSEGKAPPIGIRVAVDARIAALLRLVVADVGVESAAALLPALHLSVGGAGC